MLKRVEIESKTEAEAYEMAKELLHIPTDKIRLTVLREKKGLLGIGGSFVYEARPNVDLGLAGKDYLEEIITNLEIDVKMEFRTLADGEEFIFRIESNHNALLIGRDGKTLAALQLLLRNYINLFTDKPLRIVLDIGSYHETRKKQLEILATKTAKEVVATKISVKLDSMNAHDRRIIHEKLADWRDVETISEGLGNDRAVVIKYKKY